MNVVYIPETHLGQSSHCYPWGVSIESRANWVVVSHCVGAYRSYSYSLSHSASDDQCAISTSKGSGKVINI